MKIFKHSSQISAWVSEQKSLGKSIGFVPTMGALHSGHISLIQQCKRDNDLCVCSVFVNPTQFNNVEDLKKYPRTEEADQLILEKNHCDAVFFPNVEDIYHDGEKTETFDFSGLEIKMEGAFRPGHFDGVGTIVHKLFCIVQPDKAYFGEKDFQQLQIIRAMVKNLSLPIEVVPMPIFREKDGLAMSSRNQRLTPFFRKEATRIYAVLEQIRDWKKELPLSVARQKAIALFSESPLELEYLSFCNEETLTEVSSWDESPNVRAFVAAFAGEIRLIDNIKII